MTDKFNGTTMDATLWAKAFSERFEVTAKDGKPVDTGDLMLGWFANSIMAGYDEASRRSTERRTGVKLKKRSPPCIAEPIKL